MAISDYIVDKTPLAELVNLVNDNDLESELFALGDQRYCMRIYCEPKYNILQRQYPSTVLSVIDNGSATMIDVSKDNRTSFGTINLDSKTGKNRDGYQVVFESIEFSIEDILCFYDISRIKNRFNCKYLGDNLRKNGEVEFTNTYGNLYTPSAIIKTKNRMLPVSNRLFGQYFTEKTSVIKNGKVYEIPWWYKLVFESSYDFIVVHYEDGLEHLVDENCTHIEYSFELMEQIVKVIDDKIDDSVRNIKGELMSYPEEYIRPHKASLMFGSDDKIGKRILYRIVEDGIDGLENSSSWLYNGFTYKADLSDLNFPTDTIINGYTLGEIRRKVHVSFPLRIILNDTGTSSKMLAKNKTKHHYVRNDDKIFFNNPTGEVRSLIRDLKSKLGELLIIENLSELNWKSSKRNSGVKRPVKHVETFRPYLSSKTNKKRFSFDDISETSTVIYCSMDDNLGRYELGYMSSGIFNEIYGPVEYASVLKTGLEKAQSLRNFITVSEAIDRVNREFFEMGDNNQIAKIKDVYMENLYLCRERIPSRSLYEEIMEGCTKDPEIIEIIKQREEFRQKINYFDLEVIRRPLFRKLMKIIEINSLSAEDLFGPTTEVKNIDSIVHKKYPIMAHMYNSGLRSEEFSDYVKLMDKSRGYE